MTGKEWIFLFVSIIFGSGIIVFFLQKSHDEKKLISEEKYKYVEIMRKKIDTALETFLKMAQGDDTKQDKLIEQYARKYLEVFDYFQLNQSYFTTIEREMFELIETHHEMENVLNQNLEVPQLKRQLEQLLRKSFDLLKDMRDACVEHKI